jgi:hypothetical protein
MLVYLLTLVMAAAAPAERKSVLEVREPLEVPGRVLEPGSYVVRLRAEPQQANVSRVLSLVEILDRTETNVLARVYSLPDYNQPPEGKPLFTFYDRGAGQPKALSTWFHPSVEYGEQVVYPTEQAAAIAKATRQNVLSMPVEAPAPAAANAPAPAAVPRRAAAGGPRRAELPKAAGYLPLAAWLGLATLVAFFLFRMYRRDPAEALRARNRALALKVAAATYQNYKRTLK